MTPDDLAKLLDPPRPKGHDWSIVVDKVTLEQIGIGVKTEAYAKWLTKHTLRMRYFGPKRVEIWKRDD